MAMALLRCRLANEPGGLEEVARRPRLKAPSGDVDTKAEGTGLRTTMFLLGEPRKAGPKPPTDVTTGVKGGSGKHRLSRRGRLLLCTGFGLLPVGSKQS